MFSLTAQLGNLLTDVGMPAWASSRETEEDMPTREQSEEDAGCMQRVSTGDPDAMQPLFDHWKLPLLTYFYRSLGSHADAEDLTLKTFERVYRAAPRYRPEARFSTWLFSIARRELLHELRRRRRKPIEALPPEELCRLDAQSEGAGERHTRELEEHLLHALQQLPERERSAILMTASGEIGPDEAAQTLKVSRKHFSVILHRARQALRSVFRNTSLE